MRDGVFTADVEAATEEECARYGISALLTLPLLLTPVSPV